MMGSIRLRMSAALSLVALGFAVGCGRPAPDKMQPMCKEEVGLYFSNLNADAELRKMDMKTPRPHLEDPISTGREYSDFLWSPDSKAVIITNAVCAKCKTSQIVTLYRAESNPKVLCPTCASGESRTDKNSKPLIDEKQTIEQLALKFGKDNVKLMFEADDHSTKELVKAKVRYVRRQWVYDPYGRVTPVSDKAKEKGAADLTSYTSSEPFSVENYTDIGGTPSVNNPMAVSLPQLKNYHFGGFHRLDSTFIGEMEIEYDGGLRVMSQGKEEPVRPWNLSRSLTGPQRYQTRGTSTK